GRTPHGNFVLSRFTADLTPPGGQPAPVALVRAEADFAQDGFPAERALGRVAGGGWAIQGPGDWNVARTITFFLDKPLDVLPGAKWSFRLEQTYGGHHTIGRFRIS